MALGARLRLAPLLPDTTVHHQITAELPLELQSVSQVAARHWEVDNLLSLALATAEHYRDCMGERSGVGRFLHASEWGGLSEGETELPLLSLVLAVE